MLAPSSDREIELKLLVEPGRLDDLLERLAASSNAFPAQVGQFLESRYFDTADRRLRARGVSLRVRRVGDRCIQTLKTRSTEGGAHTVRGEWEREVASMEPDLEAVVDPTALQRLGTVLPEELAFVFATRVERRLVLVEQPVPGAPPAIIEVAFDRGAIAVGDGADAPTSGSGHGEPISEVELELKAGPPRGLYHLLDAMRMWAPVQIAIGDKAERGYRLANGTAPVATRATRPSLDVGMTVEEALGDILHNCLAQWLANIAAAKDGRDIEGVHQLRIAVRRCRSALSLFTEAIGRDERVAWNERLKSVIGATGPARQLDVFLAETLPAVAGGQADEDVVGLQALARRAEAGRAAAYDQVREILDGRAHADLVLDVASWTALGGWQERASAGGRLLLSSPVVELARQLLEKRHKRVTKLGRHFARLSDAERHQVRLALKKLRYGVEFLGGLFPEKAAKRYAQAASSLQDVLGLLNDQAETRVLLEQLAAGAPATPVNERLTLERGRGFMLASQAQRLTDQRAAAEAAWEAFKDQKLFWRESGDRA